MASSRATHTCKPPPFRKGKGINLQLRQVPLSDSVVPPPEWIRLVRVPKLDVVLHLLTIPVQGRWLVVARNGRGNLHFPPHDLDGGQHRQQEKQQRKQLAKAPVALTPVAQRHGRLSERLRQQQNADCSAGTDPGEYDEPCDLYRLQPPAPLRMQVPHAQREEDAVARDDADGASERERRVGRGRALGTELPRARDREGGRDILHLREQDEDAGHAGDDEVDRHEDVAQPAEDPVAAEVADESE